MLDIALGIVRAEDGVLTKSFVKWDTDKLDFMEDAVDKELLVCVQQNLKTLDEQ